MGNFICIIIRICNCISFVFVCSGYMVSNRIGINVCIYLYLHFFVFVCRMPRHGQQLSKKFKLFYNAGIFRFWPPSRRESQS